MANQRPRQTVPRHFDWIDDDQYASNGGVPASAMLGRKLIWQDRALRAHCLRGLGCAFSRRTHTGVVPPVISASVGETLGPWAHWGSVGTVDGEWYIRASLASQETAYVVPFADVPLTLQPLEGPRVDATHTIVGTGAEANYGPFPARVTPSQMEIGLAIYPQTDGTYQTGIIDPLDAAAWGAIRNRNTFRTNAVGAALIAAWVAAGTELQHMVRFYTSAVDVTTWKQIVSVNSEVVASDTITFWPPLGPDVSIYEAKAGLQWQSMMMVAVTVYAAMFREEPATGQNYPEALYRG